MFLPAVLAAALAGAEPDWLITGPQEPAVFEIILAEQGREYRNTGEIVLRDPVFESVLARYRFATGGFARGSAPFGTYEIGAFRGPDDDPSGIGPRWMLKQVGQPEDGMAYDEKLKNTRTWIELHALRVSTGTQGCIGVAGGKKVWAEFMQNLNAILAQVGRVTFTLKANPNGSPHTVSRIQGGPG